MRVCFILEGSYPYVYGGVSSWAHQFMQAMPDTEFVLWCIGAKAENKGKFKYQLPENVVEVHEVFLDDALRLRGESGRIPRLTKDELTQLRNLLQSRDVDWSILFELFQNKRMNPAALLMSSDFLEAMVSLCREKYPFVPFADLFHTFRSMILPELYIMTGQIPKADIYHATSTGYSGLLGSLAKWKYGKRFILTEHGIYTREREEELLRAKWVNPCFKQQWIDLFYGFSSCAYHYADVITALFGRANAIQEELGAKPEKLKTLANGIHYDRFCGIPDKKEDGYVDIGAIVRIAKIKDIKTLLYSFAELKAAFGKARLHILGDIDDEEYFEECLRLVEQLHVEDVLFAGVVDVIEYMKKLDFTVLSSISEGQPLSVLESLAAKRPCVTTDVGCCRELLEGNAEDSLGEAGICVPPMHKEELERAMYRMCTDQKMRRQMGETGQKRVERYYIHQMSMGRYLRLYQEVE